MEKSDSTATVFANAVASPSQNRRKAPNQSGKESHASLNVVWTVCLEMIDRKLASLLYIWKSSRWPSSILSIICSSQKRESCAQNTLTTSLTNAPGRIETSCPGMTGGASSYSGSLLLSRSTLKLFRPRRTHITYRTTCLTTSSLPTVSKRLKHSIANKP